MNTNIYSQTPKPIKNFPSLNSNLSPRISSNSNLYYMNFPQNIYQNYPPNHRQSNNNSSRNNILLPPLNHQPSINNYPQPSQGYFPNMSGISQDFISTRANSNANYKLSQKSDHGFATTLNKIKNEALRVDRSTMVFLYGLYYLNDEQHSLFLESKKYDDDEPLVKVNDKKPVKTTIDLANSFELEVKLNQNAVMENLESQTFPLLARLKSKKIDNFQKKSVDLVCLIDKSSSMSGPKIEEVKSALNSIVSMLGENDRISIVTFDSNTERLTPLLRITEQNKSTLFAAIQGIEAELATDIDLGLKNSFKVLFERKMKNMVSSILLLSDGQSQVNMDDLRASFNSLTKNNQVTINTFGFGNDHDADLLSSISDLGGGNFYYIENIKTVDQAFLNCLGGLASCLAVDGELTFIPEHPDILSEPIKIVKPLGDSSMWKRNGENCITTMNYILNEKTSNFVLKVRVPPCKKALDGGSERNIDVVTVVFKCKGFDGKQYTIKKTRSIKMLSKTSTDFKIKEDSEVILQYYRVMLGVTLEAARLDAKNRDFEGSKKKLNKFKNQIINSPYSEDPLAKGLVKELEMAMKNVKSEKDFEEFGDKYLTSLSKAQTREYYSMQSCVDYSTPSQALYQQKAKSYNLTRGKSDCMK